jgi:serine/threonine protein kinase
MSNALAVFANFLGKTKAQKFQPALALLCTNAILDSKIDAEEAPRVNGQMLLECVTELSSQLPMQSDDVTILRGLCRGNSSVFLALCRHHLVVVKEHVFAAGSFLLTSNILYELSMLLFIVHARQTVFQEIQNNLPQVFQIETARNSLRIVLEHLPLALEDVCDRRLPPQFLHYLFCQLARVVQCIHANNLCHRDIKPSNVRCRGDGTPVLIDFDSCVFLQDSDASTFPICTVSARPPELLVDNDGDRQETKYNAKKLDVYSLGLLFIYISNSSRPLVSPQQTQGELKQKLMAAVPISNSLRCRLGPDLTPIVESMLLPDPKLRPNVEQIMQALNALDASIERPNPTPAETHISPAVCTHHTPSR